MPLMRRLLVALAALAAVGCGFTAPAGEPTMLRVIMADDWASAPLVGEVIDAFERDHPGVRVQVQGSPFSQIPELVEAARELGQPYDLAHWHAFAAAAADLAEPVDELWEAEGLSSVDYLPGAVLDVTWGGRLYGVPLDVNALVLMANRELLDTADLSAADLAHADDFAEHAATLAELEATDHAMAVTASSWAAYGWIVAGGGQLLETAPDGTAALDAQGLPTFTFDDPRTIAAIETLVTLVEAGHAPPPLAVDLARDAVASFSDGRSALHASGSWDLPIARRQAQAEVSIEDIAVLPLPQRDPVAPRTVLGGSSLFLPRDGQQQELAFALALALTERDVGLALAEQEGRLPARVDAYDAPLFATSPDLAAFVTQLEHAQVMPLIAFPEVATAFRDGLDTALSGRATPAEAMGQVQATAERWLAER
ncbi:MAG: extracellular solute-binding protein [Nitriliruptor sp.]|nr:MAG: extracellular solute-binding protein [Nitriliruptor sp.]